MYSVIGQKWWLFKDVKRNILVEFTVLIPVLALLILQGCSGSRETKRTDVTEKLFPRTITVDGDRFVDDHGRQVILNGINVGSKSKEEDYLFQGGPEIYANLKKWGFNSIRFLLIWDGLEPEPGVYNEAYLKEIDKRIQWAGENGLFVILDMHQDLFSVKYSDGAPEWATLDEGKPHITGEVWSDAYMLSPAVQTSFDNFWANAKAPDGIGLQDHFANLWKHIADRYADHPTVIGYDLLNEPFPGSVILQSTPEFMKAYATLVYTLSGKALTEEELIDTWSNPEKKATAYKLLSTKENFAQVIDALHPISSIFETELLQPMYQKVGHAIREVDQDHVLFLEHTIYGNMGVESAIERTNLPNGKPDPLVAYAPHGYDLVTDTENAASASFERLDFIFERIQEKASELGMPAWLGEWGAYYAHGESIVPVARHTVGQIESHLFGNAYWSYVPEIENQQYFEKAIIRPYPAYTNGELLSYSFDFRTRVLSVSWQEDVTNNAPTLIYVPWISKMDTESKNDAFQLSLKKISDSDAGWLIVPALGKGGNRALELKFREQ